MDPADSSGDNQNLQNTTSSDQGQGASPVAQDPLQNPAQDTQSQVSSNSNNPETLQTFTDTSAPVNPPAQPTTPEPTPTTAAQDLPVESTYTDLSVPPEKPPSSKKKFIILGLLLFLFLLLIGTGGLTYAVAYKKIKLEKYPDLQKSIANFVMSIPFMPKTPEFVLAKSALAHQDVTKQSFDVSLAIESDDLASQIGISTIDIGAKGAVDYSDPKNVKFFVDASITKEFNFEMRKADKMLYFKLNKLPAFLLSFMGMKPEIFDPVLNRWIAYDTTPLDTEARRSLEDREVDPLSEEYLEENFSKYIDDKVLEKMKLETVTEDGIELFKITLVADAALIDHIGDKLEAEQAKERGSSIYATQEEPVKLSEIIKSMKWELYFDKKAYYNRKAIVHVDMEVDSGESFNPFLIGTTGASSEKSKMTFAFAMKSDKFGEDVVIEIPEDAMTFEEFTDTLSEIMQELFGIDPTAQLQRANDAGRKSHILSIRNALMQYYSVCFKFPQTLDVLDEDGPRDSCDTNGPYMTSVPKDPNGTNYYYRVGTDGQSFDLCATLEAEIGTFTCPDPTYNYHVSYP